MEFSTMCRVCMETIYLEYVDLDTPFHETTYFECFNYCTKLEAQASDKLPKSICVSCANLLQNAYDFIIAAAEADRLFRGYITQLEKNDGDTTFIAEVENESKEIIMFPSLSVETKIVSEIKATKHHEDNDESIENGELQVMQLARNTDKKRNVNLYKYMPPKENISQINDEQNYDAEYVDAIKDTESITDAPLVNLHPIFEIVESIKIEKVEKEDAQKEPKPTYRYILPKVEIQPKEDPIQTELKTENQQSDNVLTLSQDSKTRTKCKKKIRKNYADHMNQHTDNRAYRCDKCESSFFTLKQLRIHQGQHHKKFRDTWFCKMCGEAFESRTKLNTHRNNDHNNNSSGLCLTCGDILPDQEALEQHVKYTHWSRKCPVECTHCKKKYQLNTLPMHVQYAHLDVIRAATDKEFSCKYCFKHYEEPSELEEHIKTHKGKHLYSCAICGKDFKGKGVFEDHKATMHPTPNVNSNMKKCNKCDFTTSDLSLLLKHRKKHYNYNYKRVLKFLCAYCPKKFSNLKLLNDHEDYQHGEQKTAHQCDLCGKKFDNKFKLQTHKKSAHENIRPFTCKECPKAFKLKALLLQHEKYHFGRKIDCPHCDKKFVQPCYLRVHLRTHTNELPYECHLCDKKFPIKVRLTYHLEKHEGIVRQCEYCPETFDNVAKLRIHRFEHIGYPYVCDICKENHHKRESFIRHMKRYHQIIMTGSDVEENRLRNMKNFYRNPKVQAAPELI